MCLKQDSYPHRFQNESIYNFSVNTEYKVLRIDRASKEPVFISLDLEAEKTPILFTAIVPYTEVAAASINMSGVMAVTRQDIDTSLRTRLMDEDIRGSMSHSLDTLRRRDVTVDWDNMFTAQLVKNYGP